VAPTMVTWHRHKGLCLVFIATSLTWLVADGDSCLFDGLSVGVHRVVEIAGAGSGIGGVGDACRRFCVVIVTGV